MPLTSPRRLLVIANPVSGGGRATVAVPALCQALRQLGVTAEAYFTTAAGDGERRARQAGDEPWDALVACGGDGTVAEVLNGLPDPTRPLGVLPIGTANVLALELRLPRHPHQVAALLAHGTTRELAIGTANGRRFLLFCGAGVDGAVVHRLDQAPNRSIGKIKWLAPIWHTVWHWPKPHLRATFADGTVLDDLSSVLVTRVRNYGGVVHLPRSIDLGSGRLHVLCFRHRTRAAWLWLGLRGLLRCLGPSRALTVVTTDQVRIDGVAHYQLDGDTGGQTPVAVGLLPQRARVFAPASRGRKVP
ncbi:MAG: diacylglycerol kinase family lipid kinase [Planctomycetes bacterium]|nr:diacylglycerol kinase family lipid kinase [Planctomycetota bacterium]